MVHKYKKCLTPWGDLLKPDEAYRCNIWQGKFPINNNASDGFIGTCPVDTYEPGNVWEWCSDWFSPNYHLTSPSVDPKGASKGTSRSMRGGSYLCHRSYCNRYRVAARSSNTPDSSTGNFGFRCVADV